MKKAIIAAVLAIIVLCIAPGALGYLAESRSKGWIERLQARVPQMRVIEHEWQRGWFTSRQRLVLEYPLPFAGAGLSRFTVHNHVRHGPVPGLAWPGVARVKSQIEPSGQLAHELREVFGEEAPLEVTTRIGLLGGGTTRIISRGRTLRPGPGDTEVTYDTLRMKVGFDRRLERWALDGRLPRLRVGGEGELGVMEVDRIRFQAEDRRAEGFTYLGDSDFALHIRGIELRRPDGGLVRVADLRHAGGIHTNGQFAQVDFGLGTGAIESDALGRAGVLRVRGSGFDVSLKHLHAPSAEALYRTLATAYASTPGDAPVDPAEVAELPAVALLRELPGNAAVLLAHDPELHLGRIGVETPEGEAVLEGVLRAVGFTAQEFEASGFGRVLDRLQADLTFGISPSLAERLPNGATLVGAALDAGYLVREGGRLVARVSFRDRVLTVNGRAGPLPLLPREPARLAPGDLP